MREPRGMDSARLASSLALVVLVTAGCGGEGSPWASTTTAATSTEAPTTTATTSAPTTTAPVVVMVAPDGSGDAPDLASAVALVASGGTIVLAAGEHRLTASLLVDKPMTIRGAGSDTTSVVGDQPPELLRFAGPGDFALEGITFRYQGTEPAEGVVAAGGVIAFTDVHATGAVRTEEPEAARSAGSGFLVMGDATGTIDGCAADDNQLHGFAFVGTTRVTIKASTAARNGEDGFYWADTAVGIAEGNTAQDNTLHGFATEGGATTTLTGNVAAGNGQGGVVFLGHATGTAEGNTATGNGLHGFGTEDQASSTLTDNTSSGNAQCGFIWSQEAGGTARRNTSDGNGLAGFWVADTAAPTMVNNIARSNRHPDGYGSGFAFAGTAGGVARRNQAYDNDWGIALGPDAAPQLADNDVHDNTRDLYQDAPIY